MKKMYFPMFTILTLLIMLSGCKEEIPGSEALGMLPSPQNGYGSDADQLAQPDDVEILSDGTMIVSDVDNNRIQVFNSDGKLIQSICAKDLDLENEEIVPTGIAKDAEENIYITLEGAGCVARFNSDMTFDQCIGEQGKLSVEEYYLAENANILIKPQGIIVNAEGDIYVIDMAKKVFRVGKRYNFGLKKFKKVIKDGSVNYEYDHDFGSTQEVTKIMRKSEGMAISSEKNLLFIAEEKPWKEEFGNTDKKRFIGVFDLTSGKFMNRLIGVTMDNGKIIDGYHYESIEGLSVLGENIYAVDEKAGKVFAYHIDTGTLLGSIGTRAPFYCDDESDCVIDGSNFNEQAIIAGTALPHLKNNWKKNELASPDGVGSAILNNGEKRLAVVDQWNSRILVYDLDKLLKSMSTNGTK